MNHTPILTERMTLCQRTGNLIALQKRERIKIEETLFLRVRDCETEHEIIEVKLRGIKRAANDQIAVWQYDAVEDDAQIAGLTLINL